MSADVARYLEMERAHYSELVARSNFANEAFTRLDYRELVVGWYSQHEAFPYERWLLGGVHVQSGALALDYGCGPGRMLLRLAPRFSRVDGVDISAEILDVARQRCATLPSPPHLFLTDGQDLPDGIEERYDIAFSVICLQHVCVYSVRRRILENLYRTLKPGGMLVFQLGYGPGHSGMVDYFADYTDAGATNGIMDVTVLHPADIAGDLASIGFVSTAFALTPTGPGDTHGAWIFVRAVKPGVSTAAIDTTPADWREYGFMPLVCDDSAGERVRQLQVERGVFARLQQSDNQAATLATRLQTLETESRARIVELEARLTAAAASLQSIERERVSLQDALEFGRADRDGWRQRATELAGEREQLAARVDIDERQLLRLRVADRRRLKTLIEEMVREVGASPSRVGVFGAGVHTEWLLKETALPRIRELYVFDSSAARVGQTVGGRVVRSLDEMRRLQPSVVLVSSLAFQDEMVRTLDSLSIPGLRIVCCYP